MSKQSEARLTKLLKFIRRYIDTNSYPPTVREMGAALGVSSTATIQYYLDKLEARGQIKRTASKNRAIELLDMTKKTKKSNVIQVPVVGKVAAGTPILATENIEEYINIPDNMFTDDKEVYVLKVTGDSMINAGIFEGDKLIVSKQSTAQNNDIVVALIDDSATVKRFFKEKNRFRLQPENDTMPPIFVKELDILGVVIGLIRKI